MKKLVTLACLAMLGAAATAVAADKPVTLTFATTAIGTSFDGFVDGMPMSIAFGKTKGSFGNADISITSEWRLADVDCPAGALEFSLFSNKTVLTAPDLSQLLAVGSSGWMCVDPATGYFWGAVEGVYPGGLGRFEGASGSWTTDFYGYQLGGGYTILNGTVIGRLGTP